MMDKLELNKIFEEKKSPKDLLDFLFSKNEKIVFYYSDDFDSFFKAVLFYKYCKINNKLDLVTFSKVDFYDNILFEEDKINFTLFLLNPDIDFNVESPLVILDYFKENRNTDFIKLDNKKLFQFRGSSEKDITNYETNFSIICELNLEKHIYNEAIEGKDTFAHLVTLINCRNQFNNDNHLGIWFKVLPKKLEIWDSILNPKVTEGDITPIIDVKRHFNSIIIDSIYNSLRKIKISNYDCNTINIQKQLMDFAVFNLNVNNCSDIAITYDLMRDRVYCKAYTNNKEIDLLKIFKKHNPKGFTGNIIFFLPTNHWIVTGKKSIFNFWETV